jgi:cation:H+ antiporter
VESYSTAALVIIFAVAGVATWVAGVFLSDATDVVDSRFNLGEAMGGLILLGMAGTLPEIAITASAAISGHLGLATGNLLGGIAMQTLVLVLLDATSRSPTPLSSLSTVLEPIVEAIPRGLAPHDGATRSASPGLGRDRPGEPNVAPGRRHVVSSDS